ncbi:MAG: hypothetical protein RLZZ598_766 [Pseudomonadota bacterium]
MFSIFSRVSTRLTLVTLVMALTGVVLTPAEAAPGAGEHGPSDGPGMMFSGSPGQADRMADRLLSGISNVSDAQRSQVREIARQAAADWQAQHEAGRALHEQMAAAFAQPVIDASAIEALRQQMLARHDASSKRTIQAMLDVSRVLSVEQRQQLAQKMQARRSMMERHRQERQKLDGGATR